MLLTHRANPVYLRTFRKISLPYHCNPRDGLSLGVYTPNSWPFLLITCKNCHLQPKNFISSPSDPPPPPLYTCSALRIFDISSSTVSSTRTRLQLIQNILNFGQVTLGGDSRALMECKFPTLWQVYIYVQGISRRFTHSQYHLW